MEKYAQWLLVHAAGHLFGPRDSGVPPVKPDWSDSSVWGDGSWWWVVGRMFQAEGTACVKAKRKERSELRWHVYSTYWLPIGASCVLGTEGFEKNGELLLLEKSLSIRKDEV